MNTGEFAQTRFRKERSGEWEPEADIDRRVTCILALLETTGKKIYPHHAVRVFQHLYRKQQ